MPTRTITFNNCAGYFTMLYYLVGVFLILLVILDRWKPRKFVKMDKQLGCDFSYLPIFGHLYLLVGGERRLKTLLDMARQCYKNKHGMITFWFVNQLYVGISDPLQAKILLKACLGKGALEKVTVDALGNSSAFAPVEIWRHRRKVMAAILGARFTKNFVDIISRHSEDLCNKLTRETLKGDFSIWDYFYSYSLDVIAESSTGINIKVKNKLHHPFFDALEESMQNIVSRICQPWQEYDVIYKLAPSYKRQMNCKKIMTDFTRELITKKKLMIESERTCAPKNHESKLNSKTLLELMIEFSGGENGYNDDELLDETLLLIVASTDTTTTSAGFICLILSLYSQVQEKAYEEIKTIVGDLNRPLNFEDLEKLKYLEAVIKEVIRLYPPGPAILRECNKDVELPSGIVMKKDSLFIINIIGINRHPRYWGADAEVFRPERFLEGAPSHPAAYMSFSYGPRNCAGQHFSMMSLKIVLSNILRRFSIKPATCYMNEKEVKTTAYLMLRPIHDFKVQIEPRI